MLSPRTRLGPYEVLSPLGAGGMGEVYRARDVRLGREVAVKVLPEQFAGNPDRLQRFAREASATAALNHPNVLTVFDVGQADGQAFVVSELLEGETIRARLEEGPLTLAQALDSATQIARGLSAAHAKGIIHRDLKPENLFLTSSGVVKILDFGLAKLTGVDANPAEGSRIETGTQPGLLLGTVGYMSPEQARGLPADARSDLFALGAVLYEMLSGRRAFSGPTSAAVIASILEEDPPPIAAVRKRVPPAAERIARRCLEKRPECRFQTATDVALALDLLAPEEDDRATRRPGESGPKWSPAHWLLGPRSGLALTLLGVVLAGVIALGVWSRVPPPTIVGYTQLTRDGRMKMDTIVSDGSRLYLCEHDHFVSTMYQVATAGGEPVPISTPLENPLLADISPNGTELLVFAGPMVGERSAWIVPLPGGSPRRLGDVRGVHGAWSPDGQQVAYVRGSDLFLVRSDGSGSRKLATVKGGLWSPRWSPDGNRLRFNVNGEDSVAIWEVHADGANLHHAFSGWNTPPNEADGNWTSDGRYFVFLAGRKAGKREIWAVREARGLFETHPPEPVQLTSGPMEFWMPTPSRDGKKLFAVASQGRGEVVRYDVATRQFVIYQSGLSAEGLAFSRDGQWMSYITYPEGALWRSKIDGNERLQLTFPPMQPLVSEWSPDGKQIAFMASEPPKSFNVYVVSADGGTPQAVVPGDRYQHDPTWSADGRYLVFGQGEVFSPEAPDYPPAIYQLDLKTREVVQIPGSKGMFNPRWSPDGRYLTAQTAPDQRMLLLFDSRTQSWVELVSGGPFSVSHSMWSRDSQHVYYQSSVVKEPGLFRVRVRDRKIEQLGSLKGIRHGGKIPLWMGLAPDDSPLVMRNLETQEVYALDFRAP